MGNYNIELEKMICELEHFLRKLEGDVSAEVMAKAWNKLAKDYKWSDRLKVYKAKAMGIGKK